MPSLEHQLRDADELAQEVVNAWGVNSAAGNAALFTPEFLNLLDKACLYRDLKSVADNHREFNILSEREEADERKAMQAFVLAYKALYQSQGTTSLK
jgi:hypothetical protein